MSSADPNPGDCRTEADAPDAMQLPVDAMYGIHAARAVANLPLTRRPPHSELARAYAAVKLACLPTAHAIAPAAVLRLDASEIPPL
jgi:aspartate ammonia-lyase